MRKVDNFVSKYGKTMQGSVTPHKFKYTSTNVVAIEQCLMLWTMF